MKLLGVQFLTIWRKPTIVGTSPRIHTIDGEASMDGDESVSVGAPAAGELLLKIQAGSNVGELGWWIGTPHEWFAAPRSGDPEWHPIIVSTAQVLALRFRS